MKDGVTVLKIGSKDKKEEEDNALAAIGAELWPKLMGNCKAYIVAKEMRDESDAMSDYYGGRVAKTVILAPSKHTRNLFPELRKAAKRIPETACYGTKPEKPADANEWWNPADEHRENYSMGGGVYLGEHRYSGWKVSKQTIYTGSMRSAYIQLAKRHDHLTAIK